jgi:DnaK suppressor protein
MLEKGAYLAAMINIQRYKKRLLDLEKQLLEQRERQLENARGELIDTPHDLGDSSVSDVAVDSHFTEAELNSIILQQVQDALRRIDDGTYGRCIVDGGPIEPKRLEAVPWTPYCLKHQALIEAAGREKTWTL